MASLKSRASAEAFTAQAFIHHTLERKTEGGRATSAGDIAEELRQTPEFLPHKEQAKMQQYIVGIQTLHRDTIIKALDPGLGGLYNGSERFVAASTLEVEGRNPLDAIAQAKEADDHEKKHQEGDHTGVYTTYQSPDGASSPFLVLGGKEFDHTAFTEGHTVFETGYAYVSNQYKGFRQQYIAAINASGLSQEQVAHTIDVTHDLTKIDDRSRPSIRPSSAAADSGYSG